MAKQYLIKKQPLKGKVAIVCGGSKGIGLESAKEIVLLGGSVAIIARQPETLEAAAHKIRPLARQATQFVEPIACDTTNHQKLAPLLAQFIERRGVPDLLINAVGYARPQYIQHLTLQDFKDIMDVNYYGQLIPILILLPHLMAARKGHIANVASMMGYFGIMGYAAYAPTKFAIVGLTEALRHELKPYNISFSVLYPPDTDTPGFQTENQTKPPECAALSKSARLLSAEKVAEVFVEGILKKQSAILPGEAALGWRLVRHLPWLARWIADTQYRQVRRELGKTA